MNIEQMMEKLPPFLKNYEWERYLSDNYIVLDFETTILDKGSPYESENKIVCSSYTTGTGHTNYTRGGSPRVLCRNEFGQTALVDAIESADFWVAHNAKFEWGWLERCGLPLGSKLSFCTQIAEYILLCNRSHLQDLSLSKCLRRRGMKDKDKLGQRLLTGGLSPANWPASWLKRYAERDSIATKTLFISQRKSLQRRGMLPLAFTRNILTPVLVDLEKKGVHLDEERVKKLHRSYVKRLHELDSKLTTMTGGLNTRSPLQMREYLYNKLKFAIPKSRKWLGKNGEPTTSYNYIQTLKPRNKKQREFIKIQEEYSKVNAALTKGLNKFYECVDKTEDKILTASFNQTVTATQRLSSTGRNYKAQLQNLARIFKPLFNARNEDWMIGEIDESQLEYRVAVFLGQDTAGMEDIKNGVDAHNITAETIFGEEFVGSSVDSVREELRTDAKADTFKPLYGGQKGTPEQERYYKFFKEKHKGITQIQNEWKRQAVNTGQVRIPSGLVFYFPNTRIQEDGYITNSTNICNYPVQSFATADIVPIAVVYQWHCMRVAGLHSFLVNTVHDSCVCEIAPGEEQSFQEIGEWCFTEGVIRYLREVYNVEFNVPLKADTKIASHWADTEHWKKKYLKG